MKKIINDKGQVVPDMLYGLAAVNPQLEYLDELGVIMRRNRSKEKVALISGGGSGHEPAHAGYVGFGMLDAAVSGNVFTSPSPDRIIEAIRKTNTGKGVLLIIKNYSGDIMNFEMAKEMAEMEGISVASIVTRDDVAVPDSTYSTGRRGIAGTIFVHKIAGASAEEGNELAEVQRIAQKIIDNTRSMGMAMTPCILPEVGKPGFTLGEDEIEIGIGIHGEPGVERTTVKTAKELAEILCEKILSDYDFTRSEAAVIINGLGGTPLMELYILAKEVDLLLKKKNIIPYKYMVGNFMTSLEMAGCSISLLKLDDELKKYLNAPCNTPAWKEVGTAPYFEHL